MGVECIHLIYDRDHRRVNLYTETTRSFVFTTEEYLPPSLASKRRNQYATGSLFHSHHCESTKYNVNEKSWFVSQLTSTINKPRA